MAEKKPPEKQEPEKQPELDQSKVIVMPVSDVADWDDEKYARKMRWPWDGRSKEEVLEAAKKLPVPKGE